MVDQQHEPVLLQILEILDTACQASLRLLEQYSCGETDEVVQLLSDLRAVAGVVRAAQEPLLPDLEHAYTSEMLENVEDTLDDIQRSMAAGNQERAAMKMECQLFPFLRQMHEAFYFWGAVNPDQAKMEHYYQEEFAAHYQNYYVSGGNKPRFRACVVVVAYNHLEMTKQCVESVLKYTDFQALNAELILVDHGSTDGVLEYFESLGVGKVIHYKANMRGTMFCALPQICDSQYYVHVANDTVVTKSWLDILLKCADSDPNIALVVPATCNMSNYQSLSLPTDDCAALLEWAEVHNSDDPRLWQDRARVLPPIGVFRIRALNEIGFWDPYLYTFDFMDDDFSLRARRHGFRQVLCEGAACYHRGSATVQEVHEVEDTFAIGNGLFQEKHGVNAWGIGHCYDFQAVQMLDLERVGDGVVNLLGIDEGFGDTLLCMGNKLRHAGREVRLYHITTDSAYLPDLRPQAADAIYVPKEHLAQGLPDSFPGVHFSCIHLGSSLVDHPEPVWLLEALSARLRPGDQLIFTFPNPFFAVRLNQMLRFSIPDAPVQLFPPEWIYQKLRSDFSAIILTGLTQEVQGLDEFIARHYRKGAVPENARSILQSDSYYAKCVK